MKLLLIVLLGGLPLLSGCCERSVPTIPEQPGLERIFYTRASGSYYTVIATTSAGTQSTTVLDGKGFLCSAPYHYRLATVHPSYANGVIYSSVIFTSTTTAKNPQNFTPEAVRPITCTLSPDGTLVAFTTLEGKLYIAGLDGSQQQLLAETVAPFVPVSFSGDSKRLAFVGITPPGNTLYSIGIDGSFLTVLAANADTSMQSVISWTPNASALIFTGLDGSGNTQIYIVNSAGQNLRPLTNGPDQKSDPLWSPDGIHITYSRAMPPTGYHDIFICNSEGGNQRNITATPNDSERYPHWSPEGKRLLFTANEPPNATLRLADTTTKAITTLAGDVYGRGFWDYSAY